MKTNPYDEFRKELETLINKHSMENGSDTPDFILAEYLTNCLVTFDVAVQDRDKWVREYARKRGVGRVEREVE